MSVYQNPLIFSDPKIAHLFKLVNMMDEIAWKLITSEYDAMRILASLLARIEVDEDQKELRELQRNMVDNYQTFLPRLRVGDARRYYFLTSEYMNKTYFKEFRGASPRNPQPTTLGE